jgi:hypothetical protein
MFTCKKRGENTKQRQNEKTRKRENKKTRKRENEKKNTTKQNKIGPAASVVVAPPIDGDVWVCVTDTMLKFPEQFRNRVNQKVCNLQSYSTNQKQKTKKKKNRKQKKGKRNEEQKLEMSIFTKLSVFAPSGRAGRV